jgi:hypothetical protein
MRFKMYIMKLVNIPIAFQCKISSSLRPTSKKEKNYMSHVPYANTDWKMFLWYIRGTSITYNGCSDLVYGYD